MEIIFRSRISILLIVFVLAILISAFIAIFKNKAYKGIYILGVALLFTVFFGGGIRYVVSENQVHIKMWFISMGSMNIADIVSVERSYNLLSSPAASLKRLQIHCKEGSYGYLISPVREKEFIEALKAVNPDIGVNVPEKTEIWRIWDWDI